MKQYDEKYKKAVERVFGYLAFNSSQVGIEAFPTTIAAAYSNEGGDAILSGLATEIAEGCEEIEADEQQIAEHAIELIERVRDDVQDIIDALYVYTAKHPTRP